LKFFKIIILTVLTTAIALSAHAFKPQPKAGFSGSASFGATYKATDDALDVNDKLEDIDSVNSAPDMESSTSPIIAANIQYYMPESKTKIFFGMPEQKPSPEIKFGFEKEFTGGSALETSLLFLPMANVWENPYASGRESTKDNAFGASIAYKNIAATGMDIELKAIKHDIEDDEIGDLYDEMQRDGVDVSIKTNRIHHTKYFNYDPYIEYTQRNRDGEAESSKSYGAGVMFSKKVYNKNMLMFNLSYEYSKFDEENPIYSKTRKDTETALFMMYMVNNPFGWKNKYISIVTGIKERESNINFYDAQSNMVGATFGVRF
jgi:hypothetical protein